MSTLLLRWFLIVVIFLNDAVVHCSLETLELIMPPFAVKDGSVILKCDHNLTRDEIHKVEWQRDGHKIVQYIKGRQPPFVYSSSIRGAVINKSRSSETQIQLLKLDFSASGSYSCSVSMETPLFSKDSDNKNLTVIEPQKRDPVITFNKASYEIGEILLANCTSAPARPAPHLTWLINGQKVAHDLVKDFSPIFNHYPYFDWETTSVKQLGIQVSELHVGNDGVLRISCISTIPGTVKGTERYADRRSASAKIEIDVTEQRPIEAVSSLPDDGSKLDDIRSSGNNKTITNMGFLTTNGGTWWSLLFGVVPLFAWFLETV